MVTLEFSANKLDCGTFLVLPTIVVDKSKVKTGAVLVMCIAWITGMLNIGVKWTRKEAEATATDKQKTTAADKQKTTAKEV